MKQNLDNPRSLSKLITSSKTSAIFIKVSSGSFTNVGTLEQNNYLPLFF